MEVKKRKSESNRFTLHKNARSGQTIIKLGTSTIERPHTVVDSTVEFEYGDESRTRRETKSSPEQAKL